MRIFYISYFQLYFSWWFIWSMTKRVNANHIWITSPVVLLFINIIDVTSCLICWYIILYMLKIYINDIVQYKCIQLIFKQQPCLLPLLSHHHMQIYRTRQYFCHHYLRSLNYRCHSFHLLNHSYQKVLRIFLSMLNQIP